TLNFFPFFNFVKKKQQLMEPQENYTGQSNPFHDLIEKAKEFEEFGKRMSLNLQNSYQEFLFQQMEKESDEADNYKKYEEKINSQSRLIDSLQNRIEELE